MEPRHQHLQRLQQHEHDNKHEDGDELLHQQSTVPLVLRLVRTFRPSLDLKTSITALLELRRDGSLVVGAHHQLKRWSPDGQNCLQTFHGHEAVRALAQDTLDTFLSVSNWSVMRWSLKSSQCIQVFSGPQATVTSLIVCRHFFSSSSSNNNDNDSNSNQKNNSNNDRTSTLTSNSPLTENDKNRDSKEDDEHDTDGNDEQVIASGSYDNLIWLWKVKKAAEESDDNISFKQLVGHSDYVLCLCELSDGTIVSGSKDMTIRLWKIVAKKASNVMV